MSFDKAKAMRNAERHVASGRLRAAIAEYRSVVDNDPRDIATLNMLGDLYAKNSDNREAITCYMQVAEHYNTQGFSKKAIAIYNKISRIQPDSVEVSAKLAELHKGKGSLSEARSHYLKLAEHYHKQGRRLEALAMYKQIALLDPNNTEVCVSLAESYMAAGQRDEAVEAYAEAGDRFSRQNKHEEAIHVLMTGYELKRSNMRILNGLVKAQSALGRAFKAASILEDVLEKEPYNRDVLYLLIDCCIGSQNAAGAEQAVIRLVELEPANYPKFLELIRIHLNVNDPESAARILSMCAEYLLAGGQAEECGQWINEILERDPNQMSGLRVLVRYNSWLNDETGVRLALERLYNSAAAKGSTDDERYALTQLVAIKPNETRFRDRLNEIIAANGSEPVEVDETLFTAPSAEPQIAEENVEVETFNETADDQGVEMVQPEVVEAAVETAENTNGRKSRSKRSKSKAKSPKLSHADQEKLQKEIDSITFYIENDYHDLAEKGLKALGKEFGDRPEIEKLRNKIGAEAHDTTDVAVEVVHETAEVVQVASEVVHEAAEVVHEAIEVAHEKEQVAVASTFDIDQIRSEFGLDDGPETPAADAGEEYETHYHMAVAYQEMGLMEDAIREFQDAAALVSPNDGTRRFFQCATLLGHCFLVNGMAKHAVTWLDRALETQKLTDEEHHGLWYELGRAHEANGNIENAAKYFERIYAENVDFRDVGERVKSLLVSR
jgi:tetratricopeptide (TPR) repeat protein